MVPLEFLSRALAPIYDRRIELRTGGRLVLVGEVNVPRVVARHEWLGTQARVMFDVSRTIPYSVVQQDNQLLVTFDTDLIDASLPAAISPQGVVDGIRLADPKGLVAIDLGPRFGSFRTSGSPGDTPDAPFRIAIDLIPSDATSAGAPESPPQPVTPTPEAPPLVMPTPAIDAIAIDPGHGGDDRGTGGPGGRREKDVTIAVALKLKAAIEGRLGIRVVLTRESDETVGLDERAARANHNKADVFVSLHANASFQPEVRGASVYSLSLLEYGEEAQRLAAAQPQVLPTVGGAIREIEVIPWEMAQTRYIEQSGALATLVEEELRSRVGMSSRSLQQAPMRVLVGANMPAVLVEMGFLSNAADEKALGGEEYQNQLAEALYEAIVRFRERLELPAPAVTSR
jgi:N-acetylmuramoyl-L-alanine amidase